jgi:restriction system protein
MQEKRMRGESAKQVTIDVLRAAGEPLHTKEVAKRVIESGRCSRLKGKTPEATIAAILVVGAKPGGPFKRVEKGTYTIAELAPTETEQAQAGKRATARRAKKPRPANASA